MQPIPSAPPSSAATHFPAGWSLPSAHLHHFGAADLAELQDDAVIAAIHDQIAAGLDVITDGEQTRLDFNLSLLRLPEGIAIGSARRRAASVRPRTTSAASTPSPANSRAARAGAVEEFERLQPPRPAGPGPEGQRSRSLHAQRTSAAQRPISRIAGRLPRPCCRIVRAELEAAGRRPVAARSASTSRR